MNWLYRLQQRLALTRSEALAVLTLSGLFLLGLGARHLQQRPTPLPPGVYAEADRLFVEGTAVRPAPESLRTPAPAPVPPTPSPPPSQPARAAVASASGVRLDLNTATAADLERLPRIGPAMARRIVDHRTQHGPFRSVRDLLHVRGIGDKTLARLAPHLYVE